MIALTINTTAEAATIAAYIESEIDDLASEGLRDTSLESLLSQIDSQIDRGISSQQ